MTFEVILHHDVGIPRSFIKIGLKIIVLGIERIWLTSWSPVVYKGDLEELTLLTINLT